MGKGFASPAQYRGDDIKPALVSNWRALTTHLNSYVPTFNADGVTLALPGDLTVAGALTTGTAIDHGALGGTGDDDHTIYSKADGTRAFTGVVSGVTPTADAHLATKGYVNDEVQLTTVYNSSGQVVPTGAATTILSWDSEEADHGGWHEGVTNPSRITVPSAGIYLVHAAVYFNSSSGTGYRHIIMLQNGTAISYEYRGSWAIQATALLNVTRVVAASANDYFQCSVRQTSGANITVPGGNVAASGTYFQVARLGSL